MILPPFFARDMTIFALNLDVSKLEAWPFFFRKIVPFFFKIRPFLPKNTYLDIDVSEKCQSV